eukprot:CAMPEP_0201680380 /NCGR_PEP_ID=MMETSP0494-20130426/50571_1 /ASSEMBLY_ACC=CAM_ASM_000839 /TAXON_ID=420259 /ORGANISM="Thalassiosira gravida, Strain GMp14c1" /LENGTH=440 /DNA_ID=CAMNT_0048164099 /DNA_START=1244 /DNA_END=2571 /DNA_ORIENTATION=+
MGLLTLLRCRFTARLVRGPAGGRSTVSACHAFPSFKRWGLEAAQRYRCFGFCSLRPALPAVRLKDTRGGRWGLLVAPCAVDMHLPSHMWASARCMAILPCSGPSFSLTASFFPENAMGSLTRRCSGPSFSLTASCFPESNMGSLTRRFRCLRFSARLDRGPTTIPARCTGGTATSRMTSLAAQGIASVVGTVPRSRSRRQLMMTAPRCVAVVVLTLSFAVARLVRTLLHYWLLSVAPDVAGVRLAPLLASELTLAVARGSKAFLWLTRAVPTRCTWGKATSEVYTAGLAPLLASELTLAIARISKTIPVVDSSSPDALHLGNGKRQAFTLLALLGIDTVMGSLTRLVAAAIASDVAGVRIAPLLADDVAPDVTGLLTRLVAAAIASDVAGVRLAPLLASELTLVIARGRKAFLWSTRAVPTHCTWGKATSEVYTARLTRY